MSDYLRARGMKLIPHSNVIPAVGGRAALFSPANGLPCVLRGGSWASEGKDCRCAARHASGPKVRGNEYGFRVVLER